MASPALRRAGRNLAIVAALLCAAAVVGWFIPAGRVWFLNGIIWTVTRVDGARMPTLHRALDPHVPDGAVLMLGDSLAGQLPPRFVDPLAVNFAIGGFSVRATTGLVAGRRDFTRARAAVVVVGTNDLVGAATPPPALERDLATLLAALPDTLKVLLVAVPPVDPRVHRDRQLPVISRTNELWQQAARRRPATVFVPVADVLADATGALRADFHQGDGLHLNEAGNRALAGVLTRHLAL